jgi:hypothetical protein
MGANVSSQIQKVNSAITTDISSGCQQEENTEQTIQGLKIKLQGCNCGDVVLQNNAVINQKCDLDQISSTIAEATQAATASQVAGLGLFPNVATTISERQQLIKQKLQTKCGSAAAVKQVIQNSEIDMSPWCFPGPTIFSSPTCYPCECGNINVVNSMNAQQQCVAKLVNEARDTLVQTAKSDQKNSILPDLSSVLLFSLLPCIVIIVIIIIVNLAKKGKSSSEGSNAGLAAVMNAQNKTAGTAAPAAAAGQPAPNKGAFAQQFLGALTQAKGASTTTGAQSGNVAKLMQLGQRFIKRGGASRKHIASALNGLPIVVVIIIAVVWFAKQHEARELREERQ